MAEERSADHNELVRLAKLVKLMRAAQRQYFAGDRSDAVIAQAKDYERRVDRAVKWVLDHRQGELFPRESGAGPYEKEKAS